MKKTGNFFHLVGVLFCLTFFSGGFVYSLQAAGISFSAQVDRNVISLNETVSLRISIESDQDLSVTNPRFNAPDFQVVHQSQSVSMSSQYISGTGLSMTKRQEVTFYLQPLKKGTFLISGIQIEAAKQVYEAKEKFTIRVEESGATTTGSGFKKLEKKEKVNKVFLRAELSKKIAFKGEQIILSYYLYYQGKLLNPQVEKFPILNGFLREDLEIPMMAQNLNVEQVDLGGVVYHRVLLAKYAAYPLQLGDLTIDSMKLHYQTYGASKIGGWDEEDPFFGFFQQVVPKSGVAESDPVSFHTDPLPEQGRPASFSGGIGDFSVVSAIDRYQVHANEAFTLTVKVEGKGGVTAIQAPKPQWPSQVELYDTKGRMEAGQSGTKIFEFLIIPRVPGKLHLPAIEFVFFDPDQKKYYSRTIESASIEVLEPLPGSEKGYLPVPQSTSVPSSIETPLPPLGLQDLRYLKPPGQFSNAVFWLQQWQIFYFICLGLFLSLIVFIFVDQFKSFFHKKALKAFFYKFWNYSKDKTQWKKIRLEIQGGVDSLSPEVLRDLYLRIAEKMEKSIDSYFGFYSHSLSRSELKENCFLEKKVSQDFWLQYFEFLEFKDWICFSDLEDPSFEKMIRSELLKWITFGETLSLKLEKK